MLTQWNMTTLLLQTVGLNVSTVCYRTACSVLDSMAVITA